MKFAVFLCVYVYIVLFIQETYGVNYSRSNTNQIEKNLGLLNISSLILSNPHYTREVETN